ncbi:hypothetical protein [Sansalvadorimonas verongulae]|uniref:hypothetical protein n=1 Tax=Sansalvadorimonas verongulae TaxID=2172824 RepID=UPI0012BCEBB1|nr:hypothetical protein [Sansalvadorimonas verongulae]MTI14991.1 hypothetical protein [Sansalvadorimonas verongulae]
MTSSQNGAILMISLVMLLVVSMIGIGGVYNSKLGLAQMNTMRDSRELFAGGNNLINRGLKSLMASATIDDEPALTPSDNSHVSGHLTYEDLGKCLGRNNSFEFTFRCKAMSAEVGFDTEGHGKIDDDSPRREVSLMYQYIEFAQ